MQDLVLANSEPDFIQTVTITPAQLAEVYKSASTIAEGEARKINGEMKDALLPQLMALAGDNNSEALETLGLLQTIDTANETTADAKIESGKQRVRLAAVWELAALSLVIDTVPVIGEVRFWGQAHIAANRMFYAVFFRAAEHFKPIKIKEIWDTDQTQHLMNLVS